MRHFGVGFSGLRRCRHQQPMRMVGELADQTPFLFGEFRTPGQPPRRLAVLAHRRELERQHAPECLLSLGIARQKSVGPVGEHAAELHGLRRQPQYAVAALDHRRPHIVEEIRKKRQRAGVLGELLRRPPRDIGGQPFGLEARRKQRGRPAHRLVQLCLA